MKILVLAPELLSAWSYPLKHTSKGLKDELSGVASKHVEDHLLLCIEDDVTKLTKVFNHDLGFVISVEEYLAREGNEYL